MEYTIEQFKEEFEDSETLQGKHDAILKAVSYHVEFGGDEFPEVIKEYKQHLIDIKKDFEKEEDVICMKEIEDGKYELFTCIKSYYESQFSLEEGTRYYVKVEDSKSILGEMWSEVGTDEIKKIINSMRPVVWIITDYGIGTLKSRNSFKEDFETYFTK